jgi:general secretion pathway protein K
MVMAVALISANLLAAGRADVGRATQAIDLARARQIGDAAVNRVILDLLRLKASPQPAPLPAGVIVESESGQATVEVEDEDGKVDLNLAPDPLLAEVLRQAGAGKAAAALVDAVADFRGADDLRRANGAERRDYERMGMPWGPKNALFDAVSELRQVPGVTSELFDRVAPAFTVHARRAGVDPAASPPRMLSALNGIDPGAAFAAPSRHETFTIRAAGRTSDGAVFVREAVVSLTGDVRKPFRVLAWRRGSEATP